MKRLMALILGIAMLLGVTSCAKKVEVPSKSDVRKVVEEEYEMEFKCKSQDISDDEKEAEWLFLSKDGSLEVTVTWNAKNPEEFEFDEEEHPEATETDATESETETEATETTEETTEATTTATTTEATSASSENTDNTDATDGTTNAPAQGNGKYVNFDEMNFYINGQKFTLGKTTLQDMIDAGVPFKEEDLGDAKNNLKPNYQSAGFKIVLGEYYSAQVYAFNDTSEGKPINECYINEIYFPISDRQEQDILSFDFPLTMTMDDLKANAGDPDKTSHYDSDDSDYYSDTFKYESESERYISGSRYEFQFTNSVLRYIYITYMP